MKLIKSSILKKLFVFALLFGFGIITATSQSSLPIGVNKPNNNEQLIEAALKNSFIVLHTQYLLEDINTKKRYNIEGKDGFFGETYSIAVKTKDGYLIENAVIHPWEYDSNYEYYKDNEQYRPVISLSQYREFDSTTYINQTATFNSENTKTLLDNNLYAITDNKFDNKGLTIKALNSKNQGWIVWITADKQLTEERNTKLSMIAYKFDVNAEKDKVIYDVILPLKSDSKILLGGIYVIPEINDIGTITFALQGILQQGENDKWTISTVVNNSTVVTNTENKSKHTKQDEEKPKLKESDNKNNSKEKNKKKEK